MFRKHCLRAFPLVALMTTGCETRATLAPVESTTARATNVAPAALVSSTRPIVALVTGQELQLTARDRRARHAWWGSGDPTVATVTSSGLVTARAAGMAQIVVSWIGGADTTPVVVTDAAAPRVLAVNLAPKVGVRVVANGGVQFATQITWSDGAARAATVSYTATGGTITQSGLFSAGAVAGTFMVVASVAGGPADTAVVAVDEAPVAQLASLTINPKTVSVNVNASVQFTAAANWSTGATTLPPLTWSTPDGGSVSTNGVFLAPATGGTYRIVVAHTGGTRRDTALVTVNGMPPVAGSVTISPKTVNIPLSGHVGFTATMNGTTVQPTYTWSTTGGTVSANGDYHAPLGTGTYRVIVGVNGSSSRDTAIVTVRGLVQASMPASFTPNLPAGRGLALVTDSRFVGIQNSTTLGPDGISYVWSGRVVSDPTAPYGSNTLETMYAGNDYGNGSGGANIFGPFDQRWTRMYFSLMLWVPANYSTHSNSEKFFYPVVSVNGTRVSSTPVNWAPDDGGPGGPMIGFVAIMDGGGASKRVVDWFSQGFEKGRWQLVEMYMQMNTAGRSDGEWAIWVQGQLLGWRRDVAWYSGAGQGNWMGIRFDGTRGGGASSTPTPPEGQVRRYNRLAFYASP